MNITGIIAEYNPFHNGHHYQIEQIRSLSQRPFLIAIISGYFCQRGEPAITSPRIRAKIALENGIDLVLQMPAFSAVGSAEIFASAATIILDRTGICKNLAFGAEQNRLKELEQIAELLIKQEDELWLYIDQRLKLGISYAKAREQFVAEKLNSETASLLQQSNQILAIEYLKSIYKNKLNLKPWLIQRQGSNYLNPEFNCCADDLFIQAPEKCNFASALAIRNQIIKSSGESGFPANLIEKLTSVVPHKALATLLYNVAQHKVIDMERFADLYYYALEKTHEPKTRYLDEALFNRLKKIVRFTNHNYPQIEDLAEQVKTKQLPVTRVKRALTNLLLNIQEEPDFTPSYIHVLGFNKQGRYLLKRMSKSAQLPVITNFSELSSVLTPDNLWQEDLELSTARIWLRQAGCSLNEIFASPVII
ncbi:MAG TPA: nucleotidyltransferase family protein [Clostridiaceae bacterium]|nr:nucleotidyltransferase family protein [Clostridiaceae bacterium]